VDAALAAPTTADVLRRVLDSDLALGSEQLHETIAAVLDSPATGRIAAQAVDSQLVDEVVRSLLASEELWLLVTEIAESPQVIDALSRQTAGVAGQITDEVRERSRGADDWAERIAQRVRPRRRRGDAAQLPQNTDPPRGST
jgi:hypothetical protein